MDNYIKDKKRVLVIGLDGATFDVLKPLIEDKKLPNLKNLIENGCYGNLLSTLPIHSGPAWTSFMTGKNPGKHGVFGFFKPNKNNTYRGEVINSWDIKTETIFHILSKANKIVGSVNLPLTYPPFEVNGFIVSCGLLTPSNDENFTSPANLFEKIGWPKEKYILDVDCNYKNDPPEKVLKAYKRCTEVRGQLVLDLMDSFDWDFLVAIFTETDRLQHFYWHFLDETHFRHEKTEKANKVKELIIDYLNGLDSIIGKIIEKAGSNAIVMVVSDHGFGPVEKQVRLSNLFKDSGLLKINPKNNRGDLTLFHRLRGFLDKHSKLYKIAKKIMKETKYYKRKEVMKNPKDLDDRLFKIIDWDKSKVYMGCNENVILVNLKNRESKGIVEPGREYEVLREEAVKILRAVKDPATNIPLNFTVYKKEELYEGPFLNEAPDIVLKIENRYRPSRSFGNNLIDIFTHLSGSHRQEGILIISGEGLKKRSIINDAQIVDIAPTVLYALGLPIPEDMDGEILKEAFQEDYLRENPIYYQEEKERDEIVTNDGAYSEEDTVKIERRLKDLGYLD